MRPETTHSPRSTTSKVFAWLKASRPASQSYIFLSLLLGQTMAYAQHGRWSWAFFTGVAFWGLLDQLYIVYANDLADQEADHANHTATIFSGGSRVLVEGSLSEKELRSGLWLVLVLFGALSFYLAWTTSLWLLPLSALSLTFLWMYSYPPVKLSYRGGGEFLQMFGVGLILPCVGYLAQAQTLQKFPWWGIFLLLPTQLACAMSTALPDAPSDRAVGKHTTSVWMGDRLAKLSILLLHLGSLGASVVWFSQQPKQTMSFWLFIPTFSLLFSAIFSFGSKPATKKLSFMVFFSLLCSLSLISIHILFYKNALPR